MWQALALLALLALSAVALWLFYLDLHIRRDFNDALWQQPAHVYGRALELYAGAALGPDDLRRELETLQYRLGRLQGPGSAERSGARWRLHTRGFVFEGGYEAPRTLRLRFDGDRIAKLALGDGTPLELARLAPRRIGGIYTARLEDRILLRVDQAPRMLLAALLVIEDSDFPAHMGISPRGIARAALANLRANDIVQGGSTITQQLVRSLWLQRDRRFARKIKEICMALLLERHFDKERIMEAYLNEVYLGQDGPRAVHGFGLASQHYFNLPLASLETHQLALLAGLAKGPSRYNPWRFPQRARARRDLVLGLLGERRVVSAANARAAQSQALDVNAAPDARTVAYPAYLDLVRRQLRRDYREDDLATDGLRIFTHFDPMLQWRAERAVETTLARLALDFPNEGIDTLQVASVIVDPHNGEVQAMIGGRRSRYAGFNRALDAERPVGSLIKPAIYLSALERPARYHLATLLDDTPFAIEMDNAQRWQPKNFEDRYHGPVPMYAALAHSYNVSSARLGLALGVGEVANTLRRLGVSRQLPLVPAMLLGAGAMTPLEVAEMYQSIASGGFHSPLRAVRAVLDQDGRTVAPFPLRVREAFDSETIYLLRHALWRVMREGTGRSAYWRLPAELAVAGKTGTSDDQRDSWAVGFADDLLAAFWLGFDDNAPTPLTGSRGAMRLWTEFMVRASPESLRWDPPAGIGHGWFDPRSGLRFRSRCPDAVRLPYVLRHPPRMQPSCVPNAAQEGAQERAQADAAPRR